MTDVNLDNINVDLNLQGGTSIDIGLDELASALQAGVTVNAGLSNIGVTVAGGLTADVGLGNVNVNADLGLDDVRADLGLDNIRVDASIKELPVIRTESKVDLGLDDIRFRITEPIRLEFAMRPVRVHLPLNYSFCIELFGIKLFRFSLCGEGMLVSEDFVPRATERCG